MVEKADPCNGVPTIGVCRDPQTIQACSTTTGQGLPSVYTFTCAAGSTCSTETGAAKCKSTGACNPGASACVDASHVQTCDAGVSKTTACPNACLTTALGSLCTSSLATTTTNFTVKYASRGPKSDYSDWTTTSQDLAVSHLLVLSFSASSLVDAKTTDSDGKVDLLVPSSPQTGDSIVMAAAAADGAGGLAFIVADPGFANPGKQTTGTVGTPRFWSWSIDTAKVSNGATIRISEDLGSGALRVFDYIRFVYDHARSLENNRPGLSLVVWLGYGTGWTCGSCFNDVPATVNNLSFNSQIWLDANTTDERWWADAVTAHELGHWVMSSYGTSPREGGRHIFGVPSLPGLVWSEGWATWHSSFTRNNSVYYDKQNGAMLYFDIAANRYSNTTWRFPVAADGLFQLMDENEVSSMLWSIANNTPGGAQTLFTTLSGTHMNTAPWPRGYTRHTWDLDNAGTPINVVNSGMPAPFFPDFLDALSCAGVPRSVIDAATQPATRYPYPSASPICP